MPLFVVVGIPGVGKTSIVTHARAQIKNSEVYVFPTIHTTRREEKDDKKEEKEDKKEKKEPLYQREVAVTEEVFNSNKDADAYAVLWKERGLNFGISKDMLEPLAEGKKVVLIAPLSVVADLQAIAREANQVCVVLAITVSVEQLGARQALNKDDQKKTHKKLAKLLADFRSNKAIEGFTEIDNSGSVEQATDSLLNAMGFDVSVEIPPPDENDLENCLPQDYLKRTIFPVLAPALHLLDKTRPADPVTFLATYLYRSASETKRNVAEMRKRQQIRQELRRKVAAEYNLEGRI